ncbi:hypothetical protein O7621_17510 [Solwaraspora sp. WMMD937]|uniref:hypothetical protein n=1 Tax=Solwaraspora sp. WMMD937 TaxID=3016090 RepID=UPI00249AAE1A|nr:hypothetical protein [Solwaraspora sp. WMMD937]WFE19723.1 hypothetical protein O7621_17510 [Solwaraspora sp. WMMD937]
MRRVLLRRTVAAVAAVVVTLPLGARPVQAFGFTAIIGAAKAAYELYKEYKEGQSLDDATDKIINTINSAKTDILAQVDRLATAQAKSCARSAIIDFNDIKNFNQTTLQAYARDTTACVTLIDSLLEVVTDKASADLLDRHQGAHWRPAERRGLHLGDQVHRLRRQDRQHQQTHR